MPVFEEGRVKGLTVVATWHARLRRARLGRSIEKPETKDSCSACGLVMGLRAEVGATGGDSSLSLAICRKLAFRTISQFSKHLQLVVRCPMVRCPPGTCREELELSARSVAHCQMPFKGMITISCNLDQVCARAAFCLGERWEYKFCFGNGVVLSLWLGQDFLRSRHETPRHLRIWL